MTDDEFEAEVLESLRSLERKGLVRSYLNEDGEWVYELTEDGMEITQLLNFKSENVN